jgi:gliding motility-associated-like protein
VATATGLASGSYSVTVTDANGCSASANVTVAQPAALTVAVTQTNVLCNGGSGGSATAAAAGGTGPYTYSWNSSPVQTTATVTGLLAGSYTVTVTDSQGCKITGTATISEPAILALDAVPAEAKCPDSNDGSITLTISGGTSPYGVIWADGITTQNRTNLLPGDYSVVVTDVNGCAQSLTTTVGFTGAFDCLIIPDIITPNNDGYNDEWRIRNIDIYPDAEVRVFNRWGKMIFKARNISASPWDGKYKGKLVPTDSYHYILYLNDGSEPRSGVISVIR